MSARPDITRTRTPRLEVALAAIDAANEDDPHSIEIHGEHRPKERAHAQLVTDWIHRLSPGASEPLLLAARAHHIRRWEIPRERYSKDRPGYLRWRKELQKFHASVTAEILRKVGYPETTIARVQDILRKRGLGSDPEVQTFEDALCLTFLETQLASFSGEHPSEKAQAVLAKTVRKMSPAARRHAGDLPLLEPLHAALLTALESAGPWAGPTREPREPAAHGRVRPPGEGGDSSTG